MKTVISAAIALSIAIPIPASAAITGNQIHEYCSNETGALAGVCIGIISGTIRGFSLAESFHNLSKTTFCIPDKATNDQLKDVVKLYLNKNPSVRHQDGPSLVIVSMIDAYPCK